MVLLTSSQVGVALSSFIIFLCTSALFLSGYVLQQKTVNDIRAAIKPQMAPLKAEPYLPPIFRENELWKGKDSEVVVVKSSQRPIPESSSGEEGNESMIGATRWQKAAKLKEKERLKEETEKKALAQENSKKKKSKREDAQDTKDKPLSGAARRKKIKDEILAGGEEEGFIGYRRRRW